MEAIKNEMIILNNFFEEIKKNKDECVMDVMVDFCDKHDIPYEELGNLLAEDKYLKDYIKNNLKKYNFIKNDCKLWDDF